MLACKDFDHRGFTCPVGADHAHHFGAMNGPFTRSEFKLTQTLLKSTPGHHRRPNFSGPVAMAKEFDRFVSDADVFLREEPVKVGINGLSRGPCWCKNSEGPLLAVDDVNQIGQHVQHGQIVFDDDHVWFPPAPE